MTERPFPIIEPSSNQSWQQNLLVRQETRFKILINQSKYLEKSEIYPKFAPSEIIDYGIFRTSPRTYRVFAPRWAV